MLKKIKLRPNHTVYLLSLAVGLVTGLGAIAFVGLLSLAEQGVENLHGYTFYTDISSTLGGSRNLPGITTMLLVVLLPALGGLATGLITWKFSKASAGTGTDQLIKTFHQEEGKMDPKIPLIKSIATIFTLATGGSGGKEGPIAQIGAGIGSYIAKLTGAGARARRTLLLSGTAAGLGAVFKAPLGGALTSAEMVYKEDIESDALIPCFISSVTAYLVYVAFAGTGHFMPIENTGLLDLRELIFYLLLGILCYPFGFLFIRGFNDTRKFFSIIKLHPVVKPALGGLLVGGVSLVFFEVAGTGGNYLNEVASGVKPFHQPKGILWISLGFLAIAFLKIFATTLTIGSGGSGGVFGPSLFIGGMLGASVGTLAQYFIPEINLNIASYVVVGMGAFYAGVASAPIAGIVMICEMTGTYSLLPPLIIVSIFTFILGKRISIYKHQAENRFMSPAHAWDMKIDQMEKIIIRDRFPELRKFAWLHENSGPEDVAALAAQIHSSDFVVEGKNGEYAGIFSLRKTPRNYNLVGDVSEKNIPSVHPSDNLGKALKILLEFDVDKVAVEENGKLTGYIRSRDIFNAYLDNVRKSPSGFSG
jgi:chloride channel protein, CIC family